MPKGCQPRGEMPLSSAERQARFRARHKDQQRAAIVHTRRRVDRRSRPQRWRGAVTELLRCKAPMLPGSKHCLTRFRARRPWTPCRPSLILTSTRSLRSTRPAVTVATDDTQWFGRFARLLDGAWPGRRPQGLRCEYPPALALDPATQAQRGSDAVLRSACPPPAGCHFYFARRVSFLSCADNGRMTLTARGTTWQYEAVAAWAPSGGAAHQQEGHVTAPGHPERGPPQGSP
jgi:hypothetical protein